MRWGRHPQSRDIELGYGKELGFFAKGTGEPSKNFKQENNLLTSDLITVQKGYLLSRERIAEIKAWKD